VEVEWRQHPARFEMHGLLVAVRRVKPHTGGRSEHHHGVLAIAVAEDADPLSRPVERLSAGDGDEPEVAFGEPLPEEAHRIVGVRGLGDGTAKDLAEARSEFGSQWRRKPVLNVVAHVSLLRRALLRGRVVPAPRLL